MTSSLWAAIFALARILRRPMEGDLAERLAARERVHRILREVTGC